MENKRLEWLDALRGFTMIMVVSYHASLNCFGESVKLSAALPFLVLMRMPAFFFISGFLAYKADFRWTVPNALRLTWKKIKIQVIPALVFLCVFIVFCRRWGADEWHRAMLSPTKDGYWFTWSLLQMFIIYYVVCLVSRSRNYAIWLLWIVSVLAYETLYMPKYFTYHHDLFFQYSSLVQTINFFPFFVFGNLVHRHWTGAQRVMDSRWFFPIVAVLLFFCAADFLRWHHLRFMWTNLPRTLSMYCMVTILVMFFRRYADSFSRDRVLGRTLQYVGQRTLDVYLIHYLLMPRMPMVGQWLNANTPNFLIDIVLSLAIGIIVTAFSLLVSNILRISPFLRYHLFGRK
ncbi:MAG: acyltransferase [Prevotella sp.]|nr:acyltransferase [Prevotella sp.]